jgi:hypothetical protein
MIKFKDATRPGEIEHRFTCFPFDSPEAEPGEVLMRADEAEEWAEVRGGRVERRNNYVMTIWPTELAVEFKLRWC